MIYTEEQILDIFKPVAEALRNKDVFSLGDLSYDKNFNLDSYHRKIPTPNPFYKDAILQRHRVEIHASEEVFPYEILREKAPNQSEKEWAYQQSIYENPTVDTWNLMLNKTKVIANPQNYSIKWTKEEQERYFKEDYPIHHTLEDYFFDIVRPDKVNFPNEVFLVRPIIPWKDEENYEVDQSEPVQYYGDIVNEYHKLDYKAGKYLLSLCEEKKIIEGREFYQYDFVDSKNYYKIIPIGIDNLNNPIYKVQFILEHDLGWLPARELMGEPFKNKEGYNLYRSIFSNSIPSLRKVIRLDSNLSISETSQAFPTRLRKVDRCTYTTENNVPCNQGKIIVNGKFGTCPACKGSGTDSSITPGGEILVKAYLEGKVGENNPTPLSDIMTFASPPTDIYKHLDERIDKLLRRASEFITNSDQAKQNTATGVESARHDFQSVMIQFSGEFFGLMAFAIEAIGTLMFRDAFEMPAIRDPSELTFRSVADITTEISEAKESKLPDTYIGKLYDEVSKTRFNTDPNSSREDQFIKRIDRVYLKDDLTITALVATGRLAKVDAVVHDSINTFLIRAVEENPKFWDLKYDAQSKIIYAYAEKELEKLIPKSTGMAADALAIGGAMLSQNQLEDLQE